MSAQQCEVSRRNDQLKIKGFFGGICDFYRCRLEILAKLVNISVGMVDCQGRKKEPKPKLCGPDIFGWAGWGPKSSVCPSKHRETKLFSGISRDFWLDIPGAPEKLEKKNCVHFCPLNMTGRLGCRRMGMNGGSSAAYLAFTPCVPLLCTLCLVGVKTEGF